MTGHAQLTSQTDLADQDRLGADGCILPRRCDGRGNSQVSGRLIDLDPAHHVYKNILLCKFQTHTPCEHCRDQQQAVEVHAIGGAARITELCWRGEPLNFHKDRPRAFHCDRDGRASRIDQSFREKSLRWIGHFKKAAFAHFKNTHFSSCAKTILNRAQQTIRLETITLKIENRIHNMLQHARTGDRAFFGDMPDHEDRHTMRLGQLSQLRSALTHLRDRARRRIKVR